MSSADQERFLQDGETTKDGETEPAATTEPTTDKGAAEGTGEEKKEGEEEKKEGEEEKKEEEAEVIVDPAKKFDPENNIKEKPWLSVFSQGTVNWYAGDIYKAFTSQQIKKAEEDEDLKDEFGNIRLNRDEI